MSPLTAPFDGTMKIGHGFNSYTQSVCLRGAIKPPVTTKVIASSLAVDHSTCFIDDFSDVVRALGISPAAYIKTATSQGVYMIDTDKFEAADMNILVHVKVTTGTEILADDVQLNLIDGVDEANFAKIYGDTFISGFTRGGIFVGVISLKVYDKSKISQLRAQLEKSISTARSSNDHNSFADCNISELAEASIFVRWIGSENICSSSASWDVDSVFRVAARFAVDSCNATQNISAILTKYTSLPSFLKSRCRFETVSYDTAGGHTFDLLADTITYSSLLHRIADMREHGPLKYAQSEDPDAYPVNPAGLNSARRDVRSQLLAIVAKVDAISQDPTTALDFDHDTYTDPYALANRLPIPINRPAGFDVPASPDPSTSPKVSLSTVKEPQPWKWVQVSGFKSNSPVLFTHGSGGESADSMMLKVYEWETKHPGEYIAGFDLRNGKVYKKVDPYQLAKGSGDGLYVRILLDDKWKFVGQRYIRTENSNSQNRAGVGHDIVTDLTKLAEEDGIGAFDYNGSCVTSLREEAITTKGSGLACRGIWIRKDVYEALKFDFE